MSSSGLIYAVIVGAWAAYLVPMWLRRQDELNEARPTERFSTAIRLLSGRAGMERRYAKDRKGLEGRPFDDVDDFALSAEREAGPVVDPDAVTDLVDVRAFTVPAAGRHGGRSSSAGGPGPVEQPEYFDEQRFEDQRFEGQRFEEQRFGERPELLERGDPSGPGDRHGRFEPAGAGAVDSADPFDPGAPAEPLDREGRQEPGQEPGGAPARRAARRKAALGPSAAERARRSKVLARRRRTTMVLFLAFTLGAIVAAVGGLAFLWAPGIPAVLLSAYIVYLRAQERRRFAFTMDQRQAQAAAARLRERQPRGARPQEPAEDDDRTDARVARTAQGAPPVDAAPPVEAPPASPHTAGRRALVEQTDHAEWVDQQREREHGRPAGEGWEPVPVPLPTYVTAPVAPRATGSVDLDAPDTWSSARSSTAELPDDAAAGQQAPAAGPTTRSGRAQPGRRARERGRTPLFDQYAEGDRPRAANE
ncbi:divisome protein SepX/GlpR [Streptomyces sp. URMC 123]|uniref:divisome protein SepX/GlpR n=1 Tax=Streptomyces sp. URMC 123 TaxID=3423403 RepID=UPI003F1E3D3C